MSKPAPDCGSKPGGPSDEDDDAPIGTSSSSRRGSTRTRSSEFPHSGELSSGGFSSAAIEVVDFLHHSMNECGRCRPEQAEQVPRITSLSPTKKQ